MRPEAEAPLVAADEVRMILRHPAIVHHLRAARVAHPLDRYPLPIGRPQRLANPQLARCPCPASQLKPPATAYWQMTSTPGVLQS